MVLGVEVGGRWSDETCTFLSRLAKARARTEMPVSHVGLCGGQGSGFLVVRPARQPWWGRKGTRHARGGY